MITLPETSKLMLKKIATLLIVGVFFWGCSEETPKRNHGPVIKEKLYSLQEAVKEKNLASIDSLLSPKILDNNESSDSLINFIYGPNDDFAFSQFGSAEVIYTNDNGIINCFIMDSTKSTDRPFVLELSFEHDMWLFSNFRPADTIPTE